MNTIPRKRIVKKLALLFVLAASFAYLRKPEPAIAGTCQEECQDQLQICSSSAMETNGASALVPFNTKTV